MSAFVIVWFDKDLWWYQAQGHSGRTTEGGFATKAGAIKAAAAELGEDVRIQVDEPGEKK